MDQGLNDTMDGDPSFNDTDTVHKLEEMMMDLRRNKQLFCRINFIFQEYPPTDHDQVYCNSTWDEISCWPTTLGGQTAVLSCPKQIKAFFFDSTKNATKYCFPNGTWQEFSDYRNCHPVPEEEDIHITATSIIYYVGFSASTIALMVALFIFVRFRALHCLRNLIHCHLIVSFILRNLLWCTMNSVFRRVHGDEDLMWICKSLVTLFNYSHVTNFFWMFIEGLYLHTMIVWAFSVDRIKLWYYIIIGWGIPAVVIIAWVIVKSKFEDEKCWLPTTSQNFDFIYMGPQLFVLFLNVIFLASIVWVLITKLRASNTIQTKHYRKAVKALVILVPLLGLTWLLFIVPLADDPLSKRMFVYGNAILQSTQGLVVAVFYCFLNGEVQTTIRMKIKRWKEHRRLRSVKYLQNSSSYLPEHGSLTGFHKHRQPASSAKEFLRDSGRGSYKSGSFYLRTPVLILEEHQL